tara:strand:- start:9464 stop:10423 length:960 start_codon:yes stop_codon:yes gene_type:complete
MIFLIFCLISITSYSDLTIYYSTSLQERPLEDGRGGLSLAASKIDELKNNNGQSLFLLLPKKDNFANEKEMFKKLNILERVKVSSILPTDSLLANIHLFIREERELPFVCSNLYKEGAIARFTNPWQNIFKNPLKIAILSFVEEKKVKEGFISKSEAPFQARRTFNRVKHTQLETRDPNAHLEEVIKLTKANYAPDIIIVMTDVKFSKTNIEVLQRENAILISNVEQHNTEDLIKAKDVNEDQLGMIKLSITNKKITDFENRVINLKLRNEDDDIKEGEIVDRIKSLEKEGKSREAKKLSEEFNNDLDRPVRESRKIEL